MPHSPLPPFGRRWAAAWELDWSPPLTNNQESCLLSASNQTQSYFPLIVRATIDCHMLTNPYLTEGHVDLTFNRRVDRLAAIPRDSLLDRLILTSHSTLTTLR